MKKFILLLALFTLLSMQALAADHELPQIDTGQYELSGDTKLACEAILCLSSGTRPGECGPALSRYFGISKKKWKDTVRARRNFLNQCPTVGEDASMQSLTARAAVPPSCLTASSGNGKLSESVSPTMSGGK